jgi:hypothetical protein
MSQKKEFMISIASSGGNATVKKYGSDYMKKIANARWKKYYETNETNKSDTIRVKTEENNK